jgi:hypothetical protein
MKKLAFTIVKLFQGKETIGEKMRETYNMIKTVKYTLIILFVCNLTACYGNNILSYKNLNEQILKGPAISGYDLRDQDLLTEKDIIKYIEMVPETAKFMDYITDHDIVDKKDEAIKIYRKYNIDMYRFSITQFKVIECLASFEKLTSIHFRKDVGRDILETECEIVQKYKSEILSSHKKFCQIKPNCFKGYSFPFLVE